MKQKYMNTDNAQWKEPELTTLISEVGGSTNMQQLVEIKSYQQQDINTLQQIPKV